MLEIDGLEPELSLANVPAGNITLGSGVSKTVEGESTVLRQISPGTAIFAEVTLDSDWTVRFVLLPWSMRDRLLRTGESAPLLWPAAVAGVPRVDE